jgi:hypothetical protein
MSSSKVLASPATEVVTKTIVSYDVEVTRLVLFQFVELLVTLKGSDDSYLGHRCIRLEGDEYLAWNNDDEYIMTKVQEKLHADPSITFD